MSFIYEGPRSFWVGSAVDLIADDRETAWAERSLRSNVAHKYFVGRYVEADNANTNRQFWSLDALQANKDTVINSPVNWAHQPRRIIGHYVDAELMYPTTAASDEGIVNPFVESLGVLYRYYFPEEVALLEEAYAEGRLFQSMECVAKTVTCGGTQGCGKEFAYRGPRDETYCACLNDGPGTKQLNEPLFLGGGLLVPPIMPGWGKAKVHDLSKLMEEHASEVEKAYDGVASEFSHLAPSEWEAIMTMVVNVAHGGQS